MTFPDPSLAPEAQQPPHSPPSLARVSTLIYGGMSMAGLLLMEFWQNNLTPAFSFPKDGSERLRLAAAGLLAAGVLLTSSAALESWSDSFRSLKNMFMKLIGPAPAWVALWLAFLSSFGEEIFFRGAIQPTFGIVPTSIIFGLAHIGPDGKVGPWSLWAVGAGLVLGWTFDQTGSLWPAITGHFLVNGVSLLSLQRQYRQR